MFAAARSRDVCPGGSTEMSARATRHRTGDRRRPQGHPRRRRVHRHDQEALRLDRRRVDRGEPPLLPAASLHRAGDGGRDRRRHPLRRDDPPVGRRRDAVRRGARGEGRHSRASRSTRARTTRPASRARRSPRGSTGSADGSRSTADSARASRSGARSSRSATASRRSHASARTRTRSPATPRCARRPGSSRSSSPRCSWTPTTRSSAATTSPRAR